MIPQSIRWRLPFSYAAIALLTALSLGGVLLAVLGDYYAQREVDYLTRNVQTVSDTMTEFLSQDDVLSETLQAQAESFSFLFQSRVRLLDADRQALADSGPLDTFNIGIALSPREPVSNIIVIKTVEEEPVFQPRLLPDESLAITVTAIPSRSRLPLPPLPGTADDGPVFYTVAGTLQGFDLSADTTLVSDRRSGSRVLQSVHDAEGNLLGYVELSEGPAYGREIVDRVAQGWAVAGIVSVIVAATAGWLISRNLNAPLLDLTNATTRMAGGDLSARASVSPWSDNRWLESLKARNPITRFGKKFARQSKQNEFELLARSFNRMADQVEETVVTLRRFVSDAAHEIHTPLTALRTNLELAPDDEFVQRAQVQVERLEMLTQGLLDLSRIEAGEQAAHAPFELVPLVQETSELYASRAEQAGLTFELGLPDTPITIQGDEAQLRRALGNLLDNGVKFTPQGGTVNVTLGLEEANRWVTLSVEDSGIGIPTDDLPHLFNRFHRGRNAAAYPGSGLGLAIVKAIVEGHGGQVTVENTAPGTRFTLRLPVLEQE